MEERKTVEEHEKELTGVLEDLVQGSEWFSVEEGFWQWIAERIMRQNWKKLSPYGLAYSFNIWKGFSDDERKKFKEQYKSERNEWLEKKHLPRK